MKKFVTIVLESASVTIEVECEDESQAEDLAFEKLESLNQTVIPYLGMFEYHAGEMVDISDRQI